MRNKSTKKQKMLDIAIKLRHHGITYTNIAKICDVSYQTIRDWLIPGEYESSQRRVRTWQKQNRYKSSASSRKWYHKNKKRCCEVSKIYYQENKISRDKYRLEYERKKRLNDLQFKLKGYLRSRMRKAIKNNSKLGSAVNDLGCSIEDLKKRIEMLFLPGMSWDNYGQWHIDHIIPLSNFDLTDRYQFLRACNFTNLQPLWAADNLFKSNKID